MPAPTPLCAAAGVSALATSLNVPLHASAVAGDLCVIGATCNQATTMAISGLTADQQAALLSNSISVALWHTTLTSTDISNGFVAVSTSPSSRQIAGMTATFPAGSTFDNSVAPVATLAAAATPNAAAPAITPVAADCQRCEFIGARVNTTNAAHTQTAPPSGWTERVEGWDTTTANRRGAILNTVALTGQAGVSQAASGTATFSFAVTAGMISFTVAPAAGAVVDVDGSLSAAAAHTADADVSVPAAATITASAAHTASAAGARPAAATVAAAAGFTATATVGAAPINADATRPVTAAFTVSAAVTTAGAATRSTTAAFTVTAANVTAGASTRTVTAGFTAAAQNATPASGSLAASASFTTAAAVVASATASLTATAAHTATADVPATGWGPPTGITATPVSQTQIDLAWDAIAAASGYDIERDGVVIATDVVGTTYSDTGLDPGTEYDYRLRSVRA